MFSGIVEALEPTLEVQQRGGVIQLTVARPPDFNDLNLGDSIAVNGICLTVEAFDASSIQFALAAETLQVTEWTEESLRNRQWNLERSLRLGDRIHGHMVSGHVDAMGTVHHVKDEQGMRFLAIEVPSSIAGFVWKKGSITLQGVSLTVNTFENNVLEVCLIPETLKRTNLVNVEEGEKVTLEVDTMARALMSYFQAQNWKMSPASGPQ